MPVLNRSGDMISEDAAARTEVLLKRLARACKGCRKMTVSYCAECPCRTAKDIADELETGRYRLGLIDLNTGKLNARDASASIRASHGRRRKEKF